MKQMLIYIIKVVPVKYILVIFLVKPEEIVAPLQAVAVETPDQAPEMQYKDKKEAIEAFKELLKDRVCLQTTTCRS